MLTRHGAEAGPLGDVESAIAARKRGDREAAIQLFSSAIETTPDFARAYNERGVTYRRMGLHDQALADFDRAIELRAEDLRMAATALGRLTGRIDAEDVLGEIFAGFCIGK